MTYRSFLSGCSCWVNDLSMAEVRNAEGIVMPWRYDAVYDRLPEEHYQKRGPLSVKLAAAADVYMEAVLPA